MRTHTVVGSAVVLLMLAVVADHAGAQDPRSPATCVLSSASRVRCLDREARRLMEVAIAASPTIARQVTDLQSTDLIVGIETSSLQRKTRGEARLIGATPAVRHVRITVRIPGARFDLVSVLGHELQHALELAAAPDMRDTVTLRAHYLRIGYESMGRGYYETDGAREAGRRVSAELAASRPDRRVAAR
jgi:hypothetical protein